jgi:RNA polymerase sigma-70 factor (ECF subfamily)
VIARHAEMAVAFVAQPSRLIRYVLIDGLPGFVTIESNHVVQTTALHIDDGKIVGIYVTRNPDKLRGVTTGSIH